MSYLICRIGRKVGCPWRINDESYDSEGQRQEHEQECADFSTPHLAARAMELERLRLPTKVRKQLPRLYRIAKRAGWRAA